MRFIVETGGSGVVDLADKCEKIRLDRLMPLAQVLPFIRMFFDVRGNIFNAVKLINNETSTVAEGVFFQVGKVLNRGHQSKEVE